jgi:hypothetical protein
MRNNIMRSKLIIFIWLGSLVFSACSSPAPTTPAVPTQTAPDWIIQDYAPQAAPADNPLKGFMPFTDAYSSQTTPIANDFPHSLEWFYVPLKNLMNGPDSFTFETGLEPTLNDIAGRGHQAVFRVYLDYPHRFSGIPPFLIESGLQVRPYSFFGNLPGESLSPDYDDPKLIEALESFIAEFGRRYDGDPRLGFITVGLIGFWGEWHTWPLDGYTEDRSPEEDWMPSQETQVRILKDFDQAFNQTKLLVRYPMGQLSGLPAVAGRRAPYASTSLNIGYHDDSFAYETLFGYDWYFMGKMQWRGALDIWRTEPIGGELRPEIQLGIWLDPPRPDSEDFSLAVDTTHVSWLIAHALFTSRAVGGEVYQRAEAGARRMGYELFVSAIKLPDQVNASEPFPVDLRIQNTGVAPFYYDWPIQLGVLDSSQRLVVTWDTPWKLSSVLPPVDRDKLYTEMSYTHPSSGLQAGTYTLLLRVVNPLSNGKSLKFANQKQDQDLAGWLTLGAFTIQ